MAPHQWTLTQATEKLRKGEISAKELTQSLLDRIAQRDKQGEKAINAFVTLDAEGAIKAAEKADQKIAQGIDQPLLGVPIAHKDLFCTKDLRTTCSSRMLHNFIPPYDATVTTRLKETGAVILGKTNMDEFAMGSSTETSWFGNTRNP
ncbi:amidase, partial [Magnetococcales bacterium HHB-1]